MVLCEFGDIFCKTIPKGLEFPRVYRVCDHGFVQLQKLVYLMQSQKLGGEGRGSNADDDFSLFFSLFDKFF